MKLPVATWRWLLAGSFLFGVATHTQAQQAPAAPSPHGYDFLTVTSMETPYKNESYLTFAPAFQGQAVLPLTPVDVYATKPEVLAKNTEVTTIINQQLSALTASGWELAQVSTVVGYNYRVITRYLFRKPRP